MPSLYDIPVFEVEPDACDACLGVQAEEVATRKPRHVHLCKLHLEVATMHALHDVMSLGVR